MSHVVVAYEKKRKCWGERVEGEESTQQQQQHHHHRRKRQRRACCNCRENFFDALNSVCQSLRVDALLQQKGACIQAVSSELSPSPRRCCCCCCVLQATSFAAVHQLVKDVCMIIQQERTNQNKSANAIVLLFLGEGLLNFVGHVPPAPSALDLDIIQRITLGTSVYNSEDHMLILWRAYEHGYNFQLALLNRKRATRHHYENLQTIPLLRYYDVSDFAFDYAFGKAKAALMGLTCDEESLKMRYQSCWFDYKWIIGILQGEKSVKVTVHKGHDNLRDVCLHDLVVPRNIDVSTFLQYISQNFQEIFRYVVWKDSLQKQFARTLLDIARCDRGSPLFYLPTELVDMIKDRI